MDDTLLTPRLRALVRSGLTTRTTMSIATGISEASLALILGERSTPTDHQRGTLVALLASYRCALTMVNAEMTRARFASTLDP